ncbi:MAG: Nif11-like leader peptide family RiPP precursor [Cyanobacteria bacterium]|nr:Nif11-like leader peptide family RiPP precursor [Cyanobacteriota bacterium]
MTQEQIQALIQAVQANPELKDRLAEATSASEATAIVTEAGFQCDLEELTKEIESNTIELSDEELEQVAGGNWGQLIKSIMNNGESCGNAVQKAMCNLQEYLPK